MNTKTRPFSRLVSKTIRPTERHIVNEPVMSKNLLSLIKSLPIVFLILATVHASPHGVSNQRGEPPAEVLDLAGKFSAQELREHLIRFYSYFVNAIEGASARAASGEQDVEKRERLTLIKIRAARACRNAVFQSDPLAAYVDSLALCVQMKALVNTPETKALLDQDEAEFIRLTDGLDKEITTLGEHFLTASVIGTLRARLEEFAKTHPIGTSRAIVPPSVNFDANLSGLGWLIKLPLAPFRALEGVDHTAKAVSDFSTVADGFSRTVAYLPLELAWESQLLVLQARREGETAGRALIDHATIRAAQLLGGFCILLFFALRLGLRPKKAQP